MGAGQSPYTSCSPNWRAAGCMPWPRSRAGVNTANIQPTHCDRLAYVYVRQSTPWQVIENRESTERQYQLHARAIALGWSPTRVEIIDEDQGRSGSTAAHRTGFQRLVSDVGLGRVGIVLMLEASRLARNNSDWYRLIEICGVSATLIADEGAVYNPRDPNDRLLLGVNRPDSYSTSYSTSHESVNLLEILLGIRVQLPRGTPSRPQMCSPCAAT